MLDISFNAISKSVKGKYMLAILTKLFECFYSPSHLPLKDLFISESCIEIKIELNFYFHTLRPL